MAPEGHGAGIGERHAVRHAHGQIPRYADDLGVVRRLRTRARDAIARLDVGDSLPDFEDRAGGRVAGRGAPRRRTTDQLPSSRDALAGGYIHDPPYLLGLTEAFFQSGVALDLNAAKLRADRDA